MIKIDLFLLYNNLQLETMDYEYSIVDELLEELYEKEKLYNKREEVKKTNKRLRVLYEILTEVGFPEDIQRMIAMELYGTADKLDVPRRVNITKDEWQKIDRNYDKNRWEAIYK